MSLLDRLRVSRATVVVIAILLIAIGLGGTLLLDQEPLFIVAAAGLCLLLLVTLPTAAEVAGEAVADGAPEPIEPQAGLTPEPPDPSPTLSIPQVEASASIASPPDPIAVATPPPLASLQTDAATALPVPELPSAPALARERVAGGAAARAGAGAGLAAGVAAGVALWTRRRRRR